MYAAGAPAGCAHASSVLTSTIYITYAPVAAASPVLVCFMPDESTAMRSSTTRSRFARRPPALHQMGGVASDDGVRVRHRRDAECSIRHNPVTPDGGGGTRDEGSQHSTAHQKRAPSQLALPCGGTVKRKSDARPPRSLLTHVSSRSRFLMFRSRHVSPINMQEGAPLE